MTGESKEMNNRPCNVVKLGMLEYRAAHDRQLEALEKQFDGSDVDTLFLVEHPPVITLGRSSIPAHLLVSREFLRDKGIDLVETDRGGDVTYHGPGQLVAYPIMNLAYYRQDVGWYLRTLEHVVIETLNCFGLKAGRIPGLTGVWVDGTKVAAIGIAIRRWITYHGLALNVSPEMSHYDHIVPCGIADRPVSSMAQLTGREIPLAEVETHFVSTFADAFDVSVYTRPTSN
jgi:lipoyl(octanoyl) transferase